MAHVFAVRTRARQKQKQEQARRGTCRTRRHVTDDGHADKLSALSQSPRAQVFGVGMLCACVDARGLQAAHVLRVL